MNYTKMTLEELFVELRLAAIAEYELGEGEAQLKAVKAEAVIVREIATRDGAIEHYRFLLKDSHPSVKLRAALGIKKDDPPGAMRVFKDLVESNAVSGVPITALQELMVMEKNGIRI